MNCDKAYKDAYEYISSNLNEKRFKHSLGVEKTAIELGRLYNEDIKKCSIAAICHDCLKNQSNEDMMKLVKNYNMNLDMIQFNSPQILHGPVGAEFCRDHFNIDDMDILNSICYHTTGRSGMSLLEKIIYISDLIEENRNFPGVENIRKTARENLDEAILSACNETIIYIINKNELLHPLTIDLRNSLIMKGGDSIG